MNTRNLITAGLAAGFVGTVVAANAAVTHLGPVPVGFGLIAPAGVYFAGLAFTLRDFLQRRAGAVPVLFLIAAGAAVSIVLGDGRVAVAGAMAFAASELVDFAVYTALKDRVGFVAAVAGSNVAGLLVDSLLFLAVAFGSLEFFAGQAVGKGWVTLAAVLAILAVRSTTRRRRPALA